MRRRVCSLLAAAVLGPALISRGSVPIEQVEAYDPTDTPPYPTGYAPINFNNLSSVTLSAGENGGGYGGITLHNAVPGSDPVNTISGHASAVARYFYTQGTVAYPFVTDVYCAQADNFIDNIVLAQNDVSNSGPVPLGFQGGARVINNAYVDDGTTGQILDLQRRIDFMAATNDAVVVAAAVTISTDDGPTWGLWSSFNTLAVTGNQSFDPTGSPGKAHADLYFGADASFSSGVVASAATALIGTAGAAGQTDARHAAVVRSLLMTGADKAGYYVRQTANNLDLTTGAGAVDYYPALSILQNGQDPLASVTANVASGSITSNAKGWSYGSVVPKGTDAVLINAAQAITGVTASLNWDVTSSQPTAGTIDTTNAGLLFSNLTFSLVPVTKTGSTYTLGPAQSNANLSSGLAGDNVQYLYFIGTLPAGQYALVVGGDPTLSTAFGLSYVLRGSFASAWNSSTGGTWETAANWTNGIPDNQAAVANFGAVPGLTAPQALALDGNRTVGQINFTSAVGYAIAQGINSGSLFIDDTGDSTGIANPLINVSAGSHTINAPVVLADGVTVAVGAAGSLNISGPITGSGGLSKTGPGSLILAENASGTTPQILSLGYLNVSAGTLALAGPTTHAARTLLVTSSVNVSGTTTRLDLGGNDLDVTDGSLAAVTSLIASGFDLTGGAKWNGYGITSVAATADSTHLTALGVIQNNQSGTASYSATHPFDTDAPAAGDILVKYTYFGDANLDGKVDGSDYSLIDAGYASHGLKSGWYNGDFNYDGVVDGSDYTLIDNAFNNQGTVLTSSALVAATSAEPSAPAAVPEPAAIAVVGFIAALIRKRRQRR